VSANQVSAQYVHFMGIGGISMGGLARHLALDGVQVSGCDLTADPDVRRAFAEAGIHVEDGHDPSHVRGVDRLVVSAAVPNDHPELQAARAAGVDVWRRMDVLGALFDTRRALGVTGTHGKSTTSGMLASILIEAGVDPSVQLGAFHPQLDGVMRHGAGPHLVAEVDESDPGFGALNADTAVITNLEDDHVAGKHDERRTYHANLEALENATRAYADGAERLVYCRDWEDLHTLVGHHPQAVTYGEHADATVRIVNLQPGPTGSTFELHGLGDVVHVTLQVPGRHNASNATAALTAAVVGAGVNAETAAQALANFTGVGRRWQRYPNLRGAWLVDDYAHHPTEVAATLQAARATGRRVRAVLQPHRWVRTARHWPALADAAAAADEVVVLDVYGAGEATIPGVTRDAIVARIRDAGTPARGADLPDAVAYLRHDLADGDLVLTLGAGDVWRVAAALAEEGAA
jgi:UDP-N-acetylmuramate--alanine ligase